MKKIIALLLASILLCAIPFSGMAAGSAHVISSDWYNDTRTKSVDIKFTTPSKNAKDFKVYVSIWCKVGPGGKAREVVTDKRIWLREGNGIDKGLWCGTRTFRIEYGEMYNLRVAKGYCYYKYKVIYEYKGKKYIAQRTDWIQCK